MSDNTNDSIDDRLSALCDDELEGAELDAVLTELSVSEPFREQWGRMNLIGAALRSSSAASPAGQYADAGFSKRVSQALDALPDNAPASDDQFADHPRVIPFRRRFTAPAGLAIAASALLAAVVVVLQFNDSSDDLVLQAAAPVAESTTVQSLAAVDVPESLPAAGPGAAPVAAAARNEQVSAEAARRINGFMINHSASRGGAGFGGTMGYARVTAYDAAYRPGAR